MAAVKVKLKLNDENVIETKLDDAVNRNFNVIDANVYPVVVDVMDKSEKITKELRDNDKVVPKGNRFRADDYETEPPYAHAGIHLDYQGDFDEIEFESDQELNFLIEIGPDPSLYLAQEDFAKKSQRSLKKKELHNHENYPFQGPNPASLICVNGKTVSTGKLKRKGTDADPAVKAQRYYKFSVTMLGTTITLDPHIEIHDGD